MRFTTLLIVTAASVGSIAAAVGCGSSSNSGTGAGTSTSSSSGHTTTSSSSSGATSTSSSGHTSTSSSSSGIGTGGGTGTGGGGAGGSAPSEQIVCGPMDGGTSTLPTTPPSGGSCVTFPATDGGELDAGVNDAGAASRTTCNPVTNAGCTGTDTCEPDANNMYYFCQPVGTMPNIVPCGDCTGAQQYCAAGGLCVGVTQTMAACIQMCCTNADCGAGATCSTSVLQTPLPSGVGLCVTP